MNEQMMRGGADTPRSRAPDQSVEKEASGARVEAALNQLQAQYYQALDQVLRIPDGQAVEGALADQVEEIKARAAAQLSAKEMWVGSSCERRIWRLLNDIIGSDKVDVYARGAGLTVRV